MSRDPDAKQVLDLWQVRLAIELMAGELMIQRLRPGALDVAAVDKVEAVQHRLEVDPQKDEESPLMTTSSRRSF